MAWSRQFRQRRAKCLPYQLLRQKAWELILNDPTKGPWDWQADLNAGTFSIQYDHHPQHNIHCHSGDLQLLSTWDRDDTQTVLLPWDNPHMPITPSLLTLTTTLRAKYSQPDWHSIPELHQPHSELEKVDETGQLQFALSLVMLDIVNQHTDRPWIPFIADTANLAIRQTPERGTATTASSVTDSPVWGLLVRSPMAVMGMFRQAMMGYGQVNHYRGFQDYATSIGWQLTEEAGVQGGRVLRCRVPERGDAGPLLTFDEQHRLVSVTFARGQGDLIGADTNEQWE